MNPATDGAEFLFQANAAGASGYNETMTTSYFRTHLREDDGEVGLDYEASADQAQGTAFQYLGENIGNDADSSLVGTLWLFNPSNTTYVKHFYATMQMHEAQSQTYQSYSQGYFNTTTAIDDIQFKMSSGNFDGVIKMYGVS